MILKRCRLIADNLEEIFMVSSLGIITVVMFAQIVSRYIFGTSLVWSEELARYIFILMAFAGFSYCVRSSKHLKIDLLETFIPKLKKPLEYFADICFIALCIFMLGPSIEATTFIRDSGQFSAAMQLPIYIIYLPLIVAFVLVLIRIAEKYIKYFLAYKNKNKLAEEV
jgi:TRAP-type C4-dicarboxylate transport system permease small subunit